jgi:hypothetical protein
MAFVSTETGVSVVFYDMRKSQKSRMAQKLRHLLLGQPDLGFLRTVSTKVPRLKLPYISGGDRNQSWVNRV